MGKTVRDSNSSFHHSSSHLDWSERSLRRRQNPQPSTPSTPSSSRTNQSASTSVSPSSSPHRVTLFDLCSSDGNGLDWRTIKVFIFYHCPPVRNVYMGIFASAQVLMNGTTVIHCEPDGSRGVGVLLRLERSHGTLTWNRTPWNGKLFNPNYKKKTFNF